MLVDGKPDFARNGLTIVTFNYDRSLEAYIHAVLQARFGMTEFEAADTLSQIPIIHVHGMLGDYPTHPYAVGADSDDYHAIAANIQIIHEIEDRDGGFANPMFEAASTALRNAERVAFMGFGWHDDNVRRLRYFGHCDTSSKELHSTAQSLSPFQNLQLKARLKEMHCENMRLTNCSCNHFFRFAMELH